jgi:hypothetical protein
MFSSVCHVAFAENASFKNSGVINFADHRCLPRSLESFRWINETANYGFFFNLKGIWLALDPIR